MALRAHVKNGLIVLDEPTDLPEGTELYLVRLDEDEGEELEEALAESLDDVDTGRTVSDDVVRAKIRAHR